VKKLTTLFSPNLHLQRMIGFLFIRRLPEMLTAYREGRDLHALTAQSPTGREDISKNDRKLAKAVNLGLLYGMGAKGLQAYTLKSYGVEMSSEEASLCRRRFLETYPD
jgi:DNA polymerase-1